jgi:hypothetical protein
MADSQNEKNNQSNNNSSKNQSQFPQFGNVDNPNFDNDLKSRIESSKSNGWGSQFSRFISERKKTLLIGVIAILLFAGGTFLSRDTEKNNPQDKTANVSNSTTSENSDSENSSELNLDSSGNLIIEEIGPQAKKETKESETNPTAAPQEERVIEKSTDSITISATRGDGVTHLARNALQEYMNQTKETLTPEQAVYAEDYARRRIGSHPLEIGDKLSFSEDLLKEAISKAHALEDWQIQNLKKYTR